jgi:hypothetical protein
MIHRTQCRYAPAIPLVERRAVHQLLPGREPLWHVAKVQPTPGDFIDPFGSLPVDMQYKSKELFYYCQLYDSRAFNHFLGLTDFMKSLLAMAIGLQTQRRNGMSSSSPRVAQSRATSSSYGQTRKAINSIVVSAASFWRYEIP